MARRQLDYTIPSRTVGFRTFDSHTTDPDCFANVRDMQVFQQNHNLLLARTCRRTIFTTSMRDPDDSTAAIEVSSVTPAGNTGGLGERGNIITVPFEFSSPYINELYCYLEVAAAEAQIYFTVWTWGVNLPSTSTDMILDITGAGSTAKLIPVKNGYGGLSWFSAFAETPTTGADLVSPDANVTGYGFSQWWVEVDDNTGSVGDAIYFPNNLDIAPRLVTDVETRAAGIYRYTVATPFGISGLVGGEAPPAVNWRAMESAQILTMSLFEVDVTNFGDDVDVPQP